MDVNRVFLLTVKVSLGEVLIDAVSGFVNTLILIIDHSVKVNSSMGTIIRRNTIEYGYTIS